MGFLFPLQVKASETNTDASTEISNNLEPVKQTLVPNDISEDKISELGII